jgi:hypothetical protein
MRPVKQKKAADGVSLMLRSAARDKKEKKHE